MVGTLHLMWRQQPFHRYFWNLPSSQGVCEVFLRGRNFLQYHYIGPSKQFEPYSIDPRRNIFSDSFPAISHARNSSGQTLAVFNILVYLLGNSGSWIRIRIQYLLIWALISLRPNMHEFWTSAPTKNINTHKKKAFLKLKEK